MTIKEERKELQKIGFEVLESNENSIIYKRVILEKQRKKKVVRAIEMELPKVTVNYFDKDDFEELRKISDDVYETYLTKNKTHVKKFIDELIDFIRK